MATVIDTLIFDRTSDDVERVKALKTQIMSEGFSSLSSAERAEYLAGMRGAYNYTDLNRVGKAVAYIASRMEAIPDELKAYRQSHGVAEDSAFDLPYDPEKVSVNPKTDWSVSDIPTKAQIKVYLANISNLRSILTLPSGTPSSPSTLNNMSYVTANRIESILYTIFQQLTEVEQEWYDLIDRAMSDRMYAGEVFAGEI